MKQLFLIIQTTLLACLLMVTTAVAVPALINYQGVLSNNGIPVITEVRVVFSFWDSESNGNQLGNVWFDENFVTPDAGGVYSTQVGDDINPIPVDIFANTNVWLEVSIEGVPLTPRQQVTSVAFAIRAEHASTADVATSADSVAQGSITSASIASGAVTTDKLANGVVTSSSIALDSIHATHHTTGSITLDKLAPVCVDGESLLQTSAGWTCGIACKDVVGNCIPVEMRPCYNGISGAFGKGACPAGQMFCNSSGTGFGICEREVLPTSEDCYGNDWDCDGSRFECSWLHPTTLSNNISPDGSDASQPKVAMDVSGNVMVVWNQSDGVNYQIFKSECLNGVWTHPLTLTDSISPDDSSASFPDVAMNDSGNVVIVRYQSDGVKIRYLKVNFGYHKLSHEITKILAWGHSLKS